MDRLNPPPNNHKVLKNRGKKTESVKLKFCIDNDLIIETTS